MRSLLSFLAVLCLGLPAVYACPRPYHAPYVAPYIAPVAPLYIPVAIPLYGVSFQPGYSIPPALTSAPPTTPAPAVSPAAAGAPASVPSAAAPSPPPATAPAGGGLALLQNKCASCHSEANAQAKGKGHVLFQGNTLAPLTDKQVLQVYKELYAGRMPKTGSASDEEVAQMLAVFDQTK